MQNRRKMGHSKNKYKGVLARGDKWRMVIRKDKVFHGIGGFATEDDAARAYNAKAIELFGQFACLNIIPDSTPSESISEAA